MTDIYDILEQLRNKANNEEIYELRSRITALEDIVQELMEELDDQKRKSKRQPPKT